MDTSAIPELGDIPTVVNCPPCLPARGKRKREDAKELVKEALEELAREDEAGEELEEEEAALEARLEAMRKVLLRFILGGSIVFSPAPHLPLPLPPGSPSMFWSSVSLLEDTNNLKDTNTFEDTNTLEDTNTPEDANTLEDAIEIITAEQF